MSIKIYNGFKIDTSNIFQVMCIIDNHRPMMAQKANKLAESFFENMAQGFTVKPKTVAEGWRQISNVWDECQRDLKRGVRMPWADTEFKLTVFPCSRHGYLGIAYVEHPDWFDDFCKSEFVSDFSYYNNTDHPEDITQADWDARWDAWKYVLGRDGNGIPSMCGFTIDVTDPRGPDVFLFKHKIDNIIKAQIES